MWVTEDPYLHLDGVHAILDEFSINRAGEYPGKVGIFMTDRDNLTGNAFAYRGGLCTTNYSFAAISIHDPSQVVPVSKYSYDVFTFTHELGHTFGSQHTHACAWGPNQNEPIDTCFTTEGNCVGGPLPVNGGTMMSYCTSKPNIGVNFENGFGQEPGDRIRSYINQRQCIVGPTSCNIPYNQNVFDENPWLNNVISDEYCHSTEIDVYDNQYYWVYIKSAVGNRLYYQDQFYCEDLVGQFNCLELYKEYLTEVTSSSCGCDECDDPLPICDADACTGDGIEKLINCECVLTEPTKTGCNDPTALNYEEGVNCPDNDTCIYEEEEEEEEEEPNPTPPLECMDEEIFTKFTWLSDLVNMNNCEGTTITEYKEPSYSFIQIEDLNSRDLYFQNGNYYCTDGPNYSCLEQYGLSNIELCWSCNDDGEVECNNSCLLYTSPSPRDS